MFTTSITTTWSGKMENQDQVDTVKLMSLFPTEIWLTILNHVDKSSDYLHISDSSSFLKSTLETLRTTALFPDVFQILHKWKKTKFQRVSIDELRKLRLVCSAWKNGVDKILHNLDYPFFPQVAPAFRNANDFVKYKEPFSGNPFLARAVEFAFAPTLGDLSTYYPELLQMLGNFGHQIWYCSIQTFIQNTAEQITFFHKLATILELMPNLRRLKFTSWNKFDDELLLPEDHFPTLQHLTAVNQKYMPLLVFQRLAQRNPQITSVFCRSLTSEHLSVYLKEMPNLLDLSIDFKEIEQYNKFRDCGKVACRGLKKLSVDLRILEVSWESVFSSVESHWGNTLLDLRVVLPDPKFHTDGCSLKVPNVQNLQLCMHHPTNLDFILPTKNHLERLNIICREYENSQEMKSENILKVYECGANLHNSNIWEMLDQLKTLKVELHPRLVYVCTRESCKQQNSMVLNNFM